MPIVTIKQGSAFPEIGQFRKGEPKGEKAPGKDLRDRFRVVFYPGEDNEKSEAKFLRVYESNLVKRVVFVLPFVNPFDCFDYYYEAYSAGRMIARADGEKYIRLIDPATHEVRVNNGEPYTPFRPGDILGRSPKGIPIKARATGRLKIVLPELNRVAFMTVMTTSIYDVVRITQQLSALQQLAAFLPSGRGVAGIPLTLQRRIVNVTWTQEDGSARRVPHGLIDIETDPQWVEGMLSRLSTFAMTSAAKDQIAQALLPSQASEDVGLDIQRDHLDLADYEADYGDQIDAENTQEVIDGSAGGAPAQEPPAVCASCGLPEPDHKSDCTVSKPPAATSDAAIQEYFGICYNTLKWKREQAMAFLQQHGGDYFVAAAAARKLNP